MHRRQDACLAMRVAQEIVHEAERIAAERAMVIPTFTKTEFQIPYCRPMDRQLRVMPRGSRPIYRSHFLMLPVAVMVGIVAPAVAQVDASNKGDVAFSLFRMADDDELLVMGAAKAHTLVEQHLTPG